MALRIKLPAIKKFGPRFWIICGGALFAFIMFYFFVRNETAVARLTPPVTPGYSTLELTLNSRDSKWVVACGVIEPISREITLGFDTNGVLEKMLVQEGDEVKAGQTLAHLRSSDRIAALKEAEALRLSAEADYQKHLSGARQAEKELAEADIKSKAAWLEQSKREQVRRQELGKTRAIKAEDWERSERDAKIARFEYNQAMHRYALVNELFRPEEVEMSRQRLAAATAAVEKIQAELDKCILKAPVDGRVLRVHSRIGEAYSILTPSPVIVMGDVSRLNVRMEIDEWDIAKVNPGQKVFVRADAFGERRFYGTIVRRELSLTPKAIRKGVVSEAVDRRVLEVVATLDEENGGGLYSGMRVDAYVDAASPPKQ